ncbi:hypothetical protein LEN26_010389 [Aphanomyces euteiches]|nr:hypothetical protein LEN26_010389 [Aphanomyces euteiches]
MLCANCTAATIQQKRTMIMALWADVAVLREKAAHALESKEFATVNEVGNESESDLQRERERVQALLDKDRIAVTKLKHHIAQRQEEIKQAKARLQNPPTTATEMAVDGSEINYVLDGLGRVARWNEQNLAAMRRTKVLQLFQLLQLIPSSTRAVHYKTIAKLPLPTSGQYDNTISSEKLPPEVVSAAFGRLIHLLLMLPKYLHPLVYPHPMIFNGSFSTIGQQSGEGAGCHTLYPDGSIGFTRAVAMLWQNVAYLCINQGMEYNDLSPSDIIGNLIRLSENPGLGSCQAHQASLDKLQQQIAQDEASTMLPLVDMSSSIQILPQYSPNDVSTFATTRSSTSNPSLMDWNVIDSTAYRPKA